MNNSEASTKSLAISQRATPIRNSSVEVFRIIATLTVLIVHFNGWFVGGIPDKLDFYHIDWHWIQFLINAASCVCVNLFIIISGYFGVKFRISSFVHIFLLLLCIFVPLYLVGSIIDGTLNLRELLSQFFIVSKAGYFVQCYLMLLFLSPLLNTFINNNSKKTVLVWTLILWAIEIWFGCIRNIDSFAFMNGYSVIHFVLIYMIARCVKLYQNIMMKYSKWTWLAGYVICTGLLWVMYGVGIHWGYANPINVISSVCLFMPFLYFSFYSKPINWIAKSTFAVYIIQVTYPVFTLLCNIDLELLNTLSYPLYLLSSAGVIASFFGACILYDKVFGYLYFFVEQIIENRLGSIYKKPLLETTLDTN